MVFAEAGMAPALSKLHGFNIPTFPKLVKFVIGIKATLGWRILPFLLNNMPNLEHITFSDVFVPCTDAQALNMRWNQPAEAPACLCFKIKEIITDNQEAISPQQFKLLRYLLKHANNLEILTMNAHTIDTRKREQVLKIPRGSKSCQIQFV
ncbi:putative F-box/FBD/LRR-repeat protein At3g59240 [Bidens hawaiensis]|uniref:putative F-box/FBD/LRR-repeat protein At3g59240 n=1 Tax=Bidens hawaiensis TaxID=980011 RepID=UPI004049D739